LRRIALLALACAALAGCGGNSDKAVAHVGGEAVTEKQLDAVVAHFRDEARREGRSFPDEGSPAFRRTRNQLLKLLVYRTELEQAARRLGVTVSDDDVSRRLPAIQNGGEETELSGDTFPRETVRAQLLLEGIFRRVTRDVKAPTAAELSARRNRAMAAYVSRLQRETKVRYEPGFAPGS
jgi:SurA-like protein